MNAWFLCNVLLISRHRFAAVSFGRIRVCSVRRAARRHGRTNCGDRGGVEDFLRRARGHCFASGQHARIEPLRLQVGISHWPFEAVQRACKQVVSSNVRRAARLLLHVQLLVTRNTIEKNILGRCFHGLTDVLTELKVARAEATIRQSRGPLLDDDDSNCLSVRNPGSVQIIIIFGVSMIL